MNESLLRDLHETEMEGLTELKAAIKELAEKPAATAEDVAKIQMMLSNIKLPAQDFSELKRYIYDTMMSTASNTNTQIAGVDKLVRSCNNNLVGIYNSIDKRLAELAEQQQRDSKPQVYIHKLDFSSWRVFFAALGLIFMNFGLCIYVYNLKVENTRLSANDLKYRYIKMVGDVDDAFIAEIENYLYQDKSGKILDHIEERVTAYEKTVADKIRAEEQARLRASEAANLDKRIKELKQK